MQLMKMECIDTIIEVVQGNVKTIRFNKPQRKNAIDVHMYSKVTRILNEAATDENTYIIVLTGTGDFFSSGNDLVASAEDGADDKLLLYVVEDYIKALIMFPKLIVAIVNGPAIGIATTILPLCDLVFASDKAYFYTPFTKLGFVAEACSSVTFPRLIGDRKAVEMLLLNYKMPAKEALECGLISYSSRPEDLEKKAWSKINDILRLPANSILANKKLMRRVYLADLLKANKIEIEELEKIRNMFNSKL